LGGTGASLAVTKMSWRNLRVWDVPQVLVLIPVTLFYMISATALPAMWSTPSKLSEATALTLLGVSLAALWVAILSRADTARMHPKMYAALLVAMLPGIFLTGFLSTLQVREGRFPFSGPILITLPLAIFHCWRLGRQIAKVRFEGQRSEV
jgi:hypothetical protein